MDQRHFIIIFSVASFSTAAEWNISILNELLDAVLSSVFCPVWQVYDALFLHQLLSSTYLFSSSQDLLITSFSICSRFLPLVTFPFILPSIISRRSESCLRMCPIHLNLQCCTVSKMLVFLYFLQYFCIRYFVYPADPRP